MRFRHAGRVRSAAICFSAIVALSAAASPAVAQVRIPVGPTVGSHTHDVGRNRVEQRRETVRGRYQLQLSYARKL
jgi:hypothetical protein